MKKIKVTDKNGMTEYINDGEVVNRLHLMGHGLPERIVDDIEGSYDPADVIENINEVITPAVEPVLITEAIPEVIDEQGNIVQAAVPATYTDEIPAVIKKLVKLKAEYTVEIIDISAEYALEQCINNRKSEYPKMEDFLNAYFDGGEEAIQDLREQRLATKLKYPKP